MKKNIVLPNRPILCPIPLINSTTLFSHCAWSNAFDHALNQLLCATRKQPSQDVIVTFKELYFMKVLSDEERIKLRFEDTILKLGDHERTETEHHDRDDEWNYSVNTGKFQFRVYRFHNAVCLSMNGASHTDSLNVKKGEFANAPSRVAMSISEFLDFIQAVEKLFLQPGDTEQVRAFVTVENRRFAIEAAVFYERLSEGKEVRLGYDKTLPSRGLFQDKGKVPKPRCTIRFK